MWREREGRWWWWSNSDVTVASDPKDGHQSGGFTLSVRRRAYTTTGASLPRQAVQARQAVKAQRYSEPCNMHPHSSPYGATTEVVVSRTRRHEIPRSRHYTTPWAHLDQPQSGHVWHTASMTACSVKWAGRGPGVMDLKPRGLEMIAMIAMMVRCASGGGPNNAVGGGKRPHTSFYWSMTSCCTSVRPHLLLVRGFELAVERPYLTGHNDHSRSLLAAAGVVLKPRSWWCISTHQGPIVAENSALPSLPLRTTSLPTALVPYHRVDVSLPWWPRYEHHMSCVIHTPRPPTQVRGMRCMRGAINRLPTEAPKPQPTISRTPVYFRQ